MRSAVATAALVAVPLLGAACDRGAAPPPAPAGDGSERLQAAVTGLCEAELAASGGGVDEAARAFQDDAHAELHRLAAELERRDRALTARLLEAKVRVENALVARGDRGLADLIRELREVTEEAAAAAGTPVVGCPV